MAASSLPKPGAEYGPCKGKCKHIDCSGTRVIAAAVCRICSKSIGYNKRFYRDETGHADAYVHAACREDEADRQAAEARL